MTIRDFQIATGTVLGRDHALAGKNNQDALCVRITGNCAALVVCDGCGSEPDSEVGAWLGSRWTAGVLLDTLAQRPDALDNPQSAAEFFETVRVELLNRLRRTAATLEPGARAPMLFTIVGALVAERRTALFSIGDGVLAINGEALPLGPFPNNEPPYLAYGLRNNGNAPKFAIHRIIDTQLLDTILIGSDGLADWSTIETRTLPGRNEQAGPLRQFWEDARYFTNADAVRRKLALMNRAAVTPDWELRSLDRSPGLLRDDTTLIVLRRGEVRP